MLSEAQMGWLKRNAAFGIPAIADAAHWTQMQTECTMRRASISVLAARSALGLRPRQKPTGTIEPCPDYDPINSTGGKTGDEHRLTALRGKITQLEKTNASLSENRGVALEIIDAMRDEIPRIEWTVMPVKPVKGTGRPTVDAVIFLTDWHYAEVVSKVQSGGWGEYDPDIAADRAHRFTQKALDYIKTMRSAYDIRRCTIIILGDMISGDIHIELQVTNAFPAPVAAVRCWKLLSECIYTLAQEFESTTVEYATDSNHTRLSRKPQFKNAGSNSWDYVIASGIDERLRGDKRVKVNIHEATKSLVQVGAWRFLVEHGDAYTAWNQIPHYGIQRGVRSEAWRRMKHEDKVFDFLVMGHWHFYFVLEDGHVFGMPSLKGPCEFSIKKGYVSAPAQAVMFVGSKGPFGVTAFDLTI